VDEALGMAAKGLGQNLASVIEQAWSMMGWTIAGVIKPIEPWLCSWLYQWNSSRQTERACS
jgi:hypothetical protein